MGYTTLTFAEWQTQLAAKLNDPTSTFYTPPELQFSLQDALRLWNILTSDNRLVYALDLDPAVIWYDFQTLAGSPRLSTITDFDIYTRIQLLLMEGSTPLTLLTTQFTSADIALAVQLKRDEFLLRTGCTRSIETLLVSPSDPNLTMPQTVIEAPRAYWLPADPDGYPAALQKTDEFTTAAYQAESAVSPADPITFSAGMEAPLNITLYPAPENPGQVEFITVESQPLLPQINMDSSPVATTLLIPSDFGPAIMWGALGYLLTISTEAADAPRAAIANARFDQFIDLMKTYPFTFTARNQNIPIYVDAVEVLDSYAPLWRVTPAIPSIIGLAGQNLVAVPCAAKQTITLFLTANANIPTAPTDTIQMGREVIDALTDYAQSVLMYKCGGVEAMEAQDLMKPILTLAATRNSLVKSMSIYRANMIAVTDRENKIEFESVRNEDADITYT